MRIKIKSKKKIKLLLIDYKTGKDKSKDENFGIEQSKLYSIVGFLKNPEVQEIKCGFIFIEHGTEKYYTYYRSELTSYIKDFYNLTKEIENTKHFKANVNALCDYCDYGKLGICKSPEEAKKASFDFMNSKIEF